MTVGAVILAAGASRRLGQAKQLVTLGGERLVERAVRVAKEAGLTPVVVVLGCGAQQVMAGCHLAGAQVILNEDWEEGMGSSVRLGVAALASASSVVLMTCDQPAVTAAHLQELVRAGQRQGLAVGSGYGEKTGVPAYFPGTLRGKLLLLKGDAGARCLLESAPVVPLAYGDLDVDTPEALAHARRIFG